MMFSYRLFGRGIRTDIEFPELEQAPAAPTSSWTLRSSNREPPLVETEFLGRDTVTEDIGVCLYRIPGGWRLRFDDTGCFDITDGGASIVWHRPTGVRVSDARSDLTSRVLATALYAQGRLCLHGSAVVLDEVATGFIAPKRHGKSTLALALVHSGGRLLTDDTMPVEACLPPVVHPGLHATRLWSDTADRLALGQAQPAGAESKRLFSRLPAHAITNDPAPLSALYVLTPVRADESRNPVWRTRLSGMEAAAVIIGNAKLAPLLGGSEAPALFRAGAGLASQVPVYRLHVARDLDLLPRVVETIRKWHAHDGMAAPEHALA